MTSNLRVHGSFQREPHRGRKLAAKKKEQAITCVCSLHLADLVDQYLQSSFGWSLCQCLQSSFGWSSCQCLYKRITFWLWIRAPWGAAVLVCSVPVKAVVCSVPVKAVIFSLPVKANSKHWFTTSKCWKALLGVWLFRQKYQRELNLCEKCHVIF